MVALLCSYKTGMAAFGGHHSAGLFGTAVATMGMRRCRKHLSSSISSNISSISSSNLLNSFKFS